MNKSSIFRRAADFICKETIAKNEAKKFIIVIRILILSIMFYLLINTVLGSTAFDIGGAIFYIAFIVLFACIFILSYRYRTFPIYCLFNVAMIAWIWTIVHFFGWNIGVQHFIMVLLMLCFFCSYRQSVVKIAYAIFLCIFRIMLFFIYQGGVATFPLTGAKESVFQVTNTVMIFWCISVIAFVFSKNSQELEGKLVEYNNQLKKQADTDTLTGLYNRRRAIEYMDEVCKNQVNHAGFCICICDIDYFKKVNDKYGHDIGDDVLREIARLFKEEIKGKDFVARWGGEEFLLVFPECNGDDAYIKLEDIRRRIKALRIAGAGKDFGITMTFGLAEYDFQNGLKSTIKEADEKLYLGKEKGRDVIIF